MSAPPSSRHRLGRGPLASTRARRGHGLRRIDARDWFDAAATPASEESQLAVMTSWMFFAAFGFCFALSGLADSDPLMGLIGFAAFAAGFAAHIIINRIFGIGFTVPQVALGLAAFTVAALCFSLAALFNSAFTRADFLIGFVGFGALAVCFLGYVLINYGIRGSYEMLHRLHSQGRRAS